MVVFYWIPGAKIFAAVLERLAGQYPNVPPNALSSAVSTALGGDGRDRNPRAERRPIRPQAFVEQLASIGVSADPIRFLDAWATSVVREIVLHDPELLAHAEGKFNSQGCLRALALASNLRPSETFSHRLNSYGLKHSAERLPLTVARGLILPSDYVPEENFVAAMAHYGFDRRRNEDDSSFIFNVSAMHVRAVEKQIRGRRPQAVPTAAVVRDGYRCAVRQWR